MTRTDLALTGAAAALFRGKAAELRALAETLTPADHTRAIALALGTERLASRVQTVAEQVAGFTAMAPARAGRTPDGPGDAVTLPGTCASVSGSVSFGPDLAALATELEAALVDQRDRGASAHEVAKRVRAVAKVLRGEGV